VRRRSEMDTNIVLGMIGAGRIARVHAKSIRANIANASIKSVCDAFLNDEMTDWAKSAGIPGVYREADKIFSDPEIDAVLICSSTDTHVDFINKAIAAQKHVFCEKPVDLDLERIRKTMSAVKEAGILFQIGFNRRFDHNFGRMKEKIVEGAIGVPQILKISSRDPAPPPPNYVKVSGGIFLDMMIHDFDMARFLMGSEVASVHATGAVLIDEAIGKAGDVDTAIVTLVFANGAVGVIDNSRKAVYGYDQRAEVFGSKGCCRAENDLPSRVVLETDQGVIMDKPYHFFLERYLDAYGAEIKSFVDALVGKGEIKCGINDAIMSVVVGLAAKRSLAEKRTVLISEFQ
jgi:myo-inositol 2-dehydrogenase/D-chiro-inositol 1-dehydrogenase